MRSLESLDPIELRILGCLMEKQLTTPEYYPLSLNALVAACNQKTNRHPVMSLREIEVLNALRSLLQDEWVERLSGARVDRWGHRADERLHFRPEWKAILALLMLRGPQTPGELRGRSARLHTFASVTEVEGVLEELADPEVHLAVARARRPGQKEMRWSLKGQTPRDEEELLPHTTEFGSGGELDTRLRALEERISDLESRLDRLESAR